MGIATASSNVFGSRLVPNLRQGLLGLDSENDGKAIALFIGALLTTPEGKAEIEKLKNLPGLNGFIQRALLD